MFVGASPESLRFTGIPPGFLMRKRAARCHRTVAKREQLDRVQMLGYSWNVRRFSLASVVAACAIVGGPNVDAQEDIGTRLLRDATVKAAMDAARDDEPQTLADQERLCEIPAPPFKEGER